MKCWVCDKEDFHSLAEYNPERELLVCKGCGAMMYKVDAGDEEKVKEYYRKSYRPEPTSENVLTSTRKLGYVQIFLKDFMEEKKDKQMVCGDVGCAIGYIPHWLRTRGHKATGSELTLTYRRFAENWYGIPITEELETKHKYDLISLYHVLEHLIEPDKKLAHYASLLAEGGHMLISTPEWHRTLEEASGSNMAGFTHLYHKDHINVFTETSIKNLFRKAGLVIVKEDHLMYGQTYLLTKGAVDPITPEPWETVVENVKKDKESIDLYLKKQYREALAIRPKFPEAYIKIVYEKHSKEPDLQDKTFEEARAALGDNTRLAMARSTWLYQQEYFEQCTQQLLWLADVRPNEDVFAMLGHCFAQTGQGANAIRAFYKCSEINPNRWVECMNAICREASRLPTWDERAQTDMIKQLSGQLPKPELKDPAMEHETVHQ